MSNTPLSVQVAELKTENKHLRERFDDACAQIRPLERDVSDQKREIAGLKERLQNAEIMAAQAKGYLKAVLDQQPPRMVQERRQSYAEEMGYVGPTRAYDDGIPF